MNRLFYFMLAMLLLVSYSCGNKNKSKDTTGALKEIVLEKTSIRFDTTEHDFGQVKEGERVVCHFDYENTGSANLLIQQAKASCGCTTPQYDTKPIPPGQKGTIEVMFNTKGRSGMQRKTVTIIANTEPEQTVLSFTCEIIPSRETTSN